MTSRLRVIGLLAGGVVGLAAACSPAPAPPAEAVAPVADAVADGRATAPAAPAPAVKPDPAPITDGGTFPFPDDAGGKALAKTLTPAAPPPLPTPAATGPRGRELPATIADPSPPAADPPATPPRLALAPSRSIRPAPLPDRVPADLGGPFPDLPTRPVPPAGPLMRTEGRDVSRPAELPILSHQPVPDRAPLADPTLEFTARSVISPVLPLRTDPAGFVRFDLPDPFEHAAAARPRTPVVEDPSRSLGSPPPPR
jgi:hypothetical protein